MLCSHWPGDGKGMMEGGSTEVDGEGMHCQGTRRLGCLTHYLHGCSVTKNDWRSRMGREPGNEPGANV